MEKSRTLRDRRRARYQFGAVSILTLIPLSLLLCCPDVSFSESGVQTFQERFELPRDPTPLLEQILASDEFKQQSPSFIDRLREMVREMIRLVISWIIEHLPRGKWLDALDASTLDTTWNVLSGLLVTAALVLLVWFGKRAVVFILARGRRSAERDSSEASATEKPLVSEEARKLALKRAGEGNYPEALIYLFRFTLLWLDERGQLPLHPGKTNREVLQSLAPEEPLRPILGEMVLTFNRVKYGAAACDKHDYEHFMALCRTVEETARS